MNDKKQSNSPRQKPSESHTQGIPELFAAIRYEKINEVVPVKLQFSLKKYIKQVAGKKGASAWIREVILEKLEHTTKKGSEA